MTTAKGQLASDYSDVLTTVVWRGACRSAPGWILTSACVFWQIVVEAEAYSNAPGLLRRGLEELLQHLLATFSTILDEQLSGESAQHM